MHVVTVLSVFQLCYVSVGGAKLIAELYTLRSQLGPDVGQSVGVFRLGRNGPEWVGRLLGVEFFGRNR